MIKGARNAQLSSSGWACKKIFLDGYPRIFVEGQRFAFPIGRGQTKIFSGSSTRERCFVGSGNGEGWEKMCRLNFDNLHMFKTRAGCRFCNYHRSEPRTEKFTGKTEYQNLKSTTRNFPHTIRFVQKTETERISIAGLRYGGPVMIGSVDLP